MAAELVAGRIAACANVLAAAASIYEWNGSVQCDTEHPMIIKTMARHVDAVSALVKARHSYDVPAIAVIELAGGDEAFLTWIESQTQQVSPQADADQDRAINNQDR